MTAAAEPRRLGRVAELERNIAAIRAENGKLRSQHATELARNTALVADLNKLRGERHRLAADLATAKAVPTQVGAP